MGLSFALFGDHCGAGMLHLAVRLSRWYALTARREKISIPFPIAVQPSGACSGLPLVWNGHRRWMRGSLSACHALLGAYQRMKRDSTCRASRGACVVRDS